MVEEGVDPGRVIKNFISLAVVKGGDFLLPIIMIPMLIQSLGIDGYGVVATAMAGIGIVGVIVEYGFNLTATGEISKNRENSALVSEIFVNVMSAKIIMAVMLCLAYIVVVTFVVDEENRQVYYSFSFVPLGAAFLPIWVFMGYERMTALSYINTIAKLVPLIIVWVVIDEESDAVYVGMGVSLGWVVAGLVGCFFSVIAFDITLKAPTFANIARQLVAGFDIFISRLFGVMYRDANIIILSIWVSPAIVGSYSIAEKIIKAVQALQEVVGNVFFPILSRLNSGAFWGIYKKIIVASIFVYAAIAALLFYFASYLVMFFDRGGNDLAVAMLRSIVVVVLVGGMNYVIGILGFVAVGQAKIFAKSVVVAAIVSLLVCYFCVGVFGWVGAALAFVVSELVLFIAMLYVCLRRGGFVGR